MEKKDGDYIKEERVKRRRKIGMMVLGS